MMQRPVLGGVMAVIVGVAGARAQCDPVWRGGPLQGMPGADSEISVLGVADPDGAAGPLPTGLIAGGLFTYIGTVRSPSLAYWNPGTGWVALTRQDRQSALSIPRSVVTWNGRMIVSGLSNPNPPGVPTVNPASIATLEGGVWAPLSTAQDLSGTLWLANLDGVLYTGARDISVPSAPVLRRYQPGPTIATGAWTSLLPDVTGSLQGMTAFNGRLYLFGAMQRTGVPGQTFRIAAYDPGSGVLTPLPDPGGAVNGAVVYQNELYFFGAFASPGAPSARLMKLNPAGTGYVAATTDPTAALLTTAGEVSSAAAVGGRLYFSTTDTNRGIYSLAGSNGVLSVATVPAGRGFGLTALAALPGSSDLIVGSARRAFSGLSATSAFSLARYAPATNTYSTLTGGLTPASSAVFGYFNALEQHQGELWAGGSFAGAGFVASGTLAKFDGQTWTPILPGPGGEVTELLSDSGTVSVYVAGSFTLINGSTPAAGLARWNGSALEPVTDSAGGAYANGVSSILDLALYQGNLVVAGSFSSSGRPRYLAQRSGTTWVQPGGVAPNGSVSAVTEWSSPAIAGGAPLLVATGQFTKVGTLDAKVAAWDGTQWRALGQASFVGATQSAAIGLLVYNGDLYMAAYITAINQQAQFPILVRYNPTTDRWVEIPKPPANMASGFGAPTAAVVTPEGIWITTSSYTLPNSQDGVALLRWDGATWRAFGGMQGGSAYANAVSPFRNEIVIGGNFGTVGTVATPGGSGPGVGGVTSAGWARLYLNAADLNGDRIVDDVDFVLFAQQYDVYSCFDAAMPGFCGADLNGDGAVDDTDFVIFAVAYDLFTCSN